MIAALGYFHLVGGLPSGVKFTLPRIKWDEPHFVPWQVCIFEKQWHDDLSQFLVIAKSSLGFGDAARAGHQNPDPPLATHPTTYLPSQHPQNEG